jgi:hypothetical protein
MRLVGIVSKRTDAPYRSGPFLGWRDRDLYRRIYAE